jgi:hypothetical protein
MKILVAGEVRGRLDLLFTRVATLNASKAGPFDTLFVTGEFFPPADEPEGGMATTAFEDYVMGVKEVPLSTYFIEGPSASAEAKYGSVAPGSDVFPKCTYLGPGGLELVGKLTVGFLSQRHTDKDIEKIVEPASSSTFLGADIFLSTDWGQGVAAGYDLSAMGVRDAAGTGSSTVADLAVVLRPRYHFAARPGIYFQRPPYKNHASKPKSKLSHVTRFLSLAPAAEAKDKARKWLHAISIEPIPYMTLAALVDEPADVTESPYSVFRTAGTASHKREGSGGQGGAGWVGSLKRVRAEGREGLSHQAVQQIQEEEEAKRADSGMFFWGGGNRGRGGGGGGGGGAVDPSNTTLHVANLPPGFSADDLQRGFSHYGVVARIRIPEGKDFAFVSFTRHEEARQALDARGITLGCAGVRVSWSKSMPRQTGMPPAPPLPMPPPPGAMVMPPPVPSVGGGGGHYGPASLAGPPTARLPPGPGPGPGRAAEASGEECWFCLGSEKAAVDLLVTVGESLYMAVPKGPLSPEHLLLIPISHVAGLAQLSEGEWAEFERYKAALRGMYAEGKTGEGEGQGQREGQSMVLFERRLQTRGARHTHVQVIPVPNDKAAGVREAFEEKGAALGVFFESLTAGTTLREMGLREEEQYMYVEVPGLGGKGVARLLYRLPPGGKLPLTFGRDVMADLLGAPGKVNWKNCQLGREEEAAMVEGLKARWEKWDFNEGEDT